MPGQEWTLGGMEDVLLDLQEEEARMVLMGGRSECVLRVAVRGINECSFVSIILNERALTSSPPDRKRMRTKKGRLSFSMTPGSGRAPPNLDL